MFTSSAKRGAGQHSLGFTGRVAIWIAAVGIACASMIAAPLAANALQISAKPHLSSALPADPQELMSWLPADTESVVVARGPFLIPTGSNETGNDNDPEWFTRKTTPVEIREMFEALPLELFYDFNLEVPNDFELEKTLKSSTVAYALQGSRHFREPQGGVEVTEFEGCSILVFEKDLGPLVERIKQSVAKIGASSETINGTRVMVIQEKSEGALEIHLLAFPRSNILLVANNRQYLQEVLARMVQKKPSRALPSQLPEWQFLDVNAGFWGLRHYDPTQAKLDPTSPFGDNETFHPKDPKAIGLIFFLDPKNEQRLMITCLSGDEARTKAEASSGKSVAEPQEGVRFEIELRNPKPGVLEEIYTLDRSSTLDYSIMAIEVALGRGMYF